MGCLLQEFWLWSWEAPRHMLGCSFTFFLGRFTLHISSLPVQCQWLDMRQDSVLVMAGALQKVRVCCKVTTASCLPSILGPKLSLCFFTPCISAAPGGVGSLGGSLWGWVWALPRCWPGACVGSLQVQLERIRQADSLERIRAILNDTKLTDINQLPETWHPDGLRGCVWGF